MGGRSGQSRFIQIDQDDQFAFIAGYTDGGFPYGTTWDELREYDHREEKPMAANKKDHTATSTFHVWVPDIERWPRSWMGVEEDLEYGRKLLPFFQEFL